MVSWAAQSDLSDPQQALAIHFQVNCPPNDGIFLHTNMVAHTVHFRRLFFCTTFITLQIPFMCHICLDTAYALVQLWSIFSEVCLSMWSRPLVGGHPMHFYYISANMAKSLPTTCSLTQMHCALSHTLWLLLSGDNLVSFCTSFLCLWGSLSSMHHSVPSRWGLAH